MILANLSIAVHHINTKNLDLSEYRTNPTDYYLKDDIANAICINYPQYDSDIKGGWYKLDKYGFQCLGKSKLMFEFLSYEFKKETRTESSTGK